MHEYANANANIVERELFYAKRQQQGETALVYIEGMIKLGNKLQLDGDEILRTTRRGLLPELYLYLLDKNIANMTELKQKVQLREMMHSVVDTTHNNQNKVHFATTTTTKDTDMLQTSIDKLTNALDKLNLASYDYSQQQRTRSQSPYTHADNNRQRPQSPSTYTYTDNNRQRSPSPYRSQQHQSPPFCTKCLCNGHSAYQCRLTDNYTGQTQHTTAPYRQPFNNYRPRFNNQRNAYRQNNYYDRPNYQPDYTSRNVFYGQQHYRGNQQNLN
jgi:hypothetical protein